MLRLRWAGNRIGTNTTMPLLFLNCSHVRPTKEFAILAHPTCEKCGLNPQPLLLEACDKKFHRRFRHDSAVLQAVTRSRHFEFRGKGTPSDESFIRKRSTLSNHR